MKVQTFALESSLSQKEATASFAFSHTPAESLFNEGLQRGSFLVGQFMNFLRKTFRYLYGRFHNIL